MANGTHIPPAMAAPDQEFEGRINAFFTPEMYDRIKEVMRKKGISKSGAVRFLVAKGIDWWDALDSKGREVA